MEYANHVRMRTRINGSGYKTVPHNSVVKNGTLLSVISSRTFYVPNYIKSIANNCFHGTSKTIKKVTFQTHSELVSIGNHAFGDCIKLHTLSLYNCKNLTTIHSEAFANCENLTEINFPRSLTTIQKFAFINCSSLQNIRQNQNNNLEFIGVSAFQNTSLTQFLIGQFVSHIGIDFLLHTKISQLIVHSKNTNFTLIDNILMGDIQIYIALHGDNSILQVPSSIKFIHKYAFHKNINIKTIFLSSTIESIGSNAFSFSNIEEVVFNNSALTKISNSCFRCTKIKAIDLSGMNLLNNIGKYSFMDCISLIRIVGNPNIHNIDDMAFMGCIQMNEFLGFPNIFRLSYLAFSNTDLKLFNINANLNYLAYNAFLKTMVQFYSVDEKNILFKDNQGVILSKKGDVLILYPAGKPNINYSIPEGVSTIRKDAFKCSSLLKHITFPSTLFSIMSSSISETGIVTISSTSNLSILAEFSFAKNINLIFARITGAITSVPKCCFMNCASLKTLHLPGTITYIHQDAFLNCPSLRCIKYKSLSSNFLSPKIANFVQRMCPCETTYTSRPKIFHINFTYF